MTSESADVFHVEVLLRRVVGDIAQRVYGDDWLDKLGTKARSNIQRTYDKAAEAREGGLPSTDPWTAAGFAQIKDVLRSFLEQDQDGDFARWLRPLEWDKANRVEVDIDRLRTLRNDSGHPDIADPVGYAVRQHQESLCHRVRLGCEQIERDLVGEDDEQWFPYIERVHAPGIDGWTYERRVDVRPSVARLNEGDTVEFVVTAVNPVGPREDLVFGIAVSPDGGSWSPLETTDEGRLRTTAQPPGNHVMFHVVVQDRAGGHSASGVYDDEVTFVARIKPASLGPRTS